jgi:hypothetical protein
VELEGSIAELEGVGAALEQTGTQSHFEEEPFRRAAASLEVTERPKAIVCRSRCEGGAEGRRSTSRGILFDPDWGLRFKTL